MAELDKVIDNFHKSLFKLVKISKGLEPNNIELETIHKLMITARRTDPLIIIDTCKDIIWDLRTQILNKEEAFFLDTNILKKVNINIPVQEINQDILTCLISTFQKKYTILKPLEKDEIWRLVNDILINVVKYKKLTNDYVANKTF
jgi:hypothetical protein